MGQGKQTHVIGKLNNKNRQLDNCSRWAWHETEQCQCRNAAFLQIADRAIFTYTEYPIFM